MPDHGYPISSPMSIWLRCAKMRGVGHNIFHGLETMYVSFTIVHSCVCDPSMNKPATKEPPTKCSEKKTKTNLKTNLAMYL